MISPGMLLSERYEIIDKVGFGGMADVYNAKDLRLNRNVAIKVLKLEYSNDAKFVSKFRVEAQSVAGLSHPNIVNVYDVGEDDTLYYIVMELVEGITLKKFIEKKGRLEINEAIGIGIQIAQGIEEAHKNNIIHRDIKPQNIIISKEGKVKVTDFGIAKAATSNTITSNAMGSVHYISPEQARGGYSDEKSDIYSLGVTLYEMLLGKVPFEGDSTVTVAFAHVHEEAVPLEEIDGMIPRSLSRIVQKCMQKKPDMRYESAGALIMDLRRAVSDPDGDYVEISEPVNDSPTIMITDDVVRAVKEPPRTPHRPKQEELLPEEEQMLNEDALDPKLERILKICSGVVAVIIVVVIILLVGKVAGWWGGGSKEDDKSVVSSHAGSSTLPSVSSLPDQIFVPDLSGHTLEEAEKLLEDNGLKYTLEEVESDKEANMVIRQEPEAGTQVEENSSVTIYYSVRKSDVVIPTLVNYSVDAAKAELERLGLTVAGTSREYSDSVEKDKVCGTDPVIGTSVKKGSSVRIIISDGPKNELVTVPNILSRTEDIALERLADVGLRGSRESYAYSDKYKKDRVMAQSVKAGTKVEAGTMIEYTISLGPRPAEQEEPTPEPTKAPSSARYVGTVTVSNPFDYEGDSGVVQLVLAQDGKSRTVYKGTLGYEDFPKSFEIDGWSDNNGTVTISVDNKILDGISFNVEFKKVQ